MTMKAKGKAEGKQADVREGLTRPEAYLLGYRFSSSSATAADS